MDTEHQICTCPLLIVTAPTIMVHTKNKGVDTKDNNYTKLFLETRTVAPYARYKIDKDNLATI